MEEDTWKYILESKYFVYILGSIYFQVYTSKYILPSIYFQVYTSKYILESKYFVYILGSIYLKVYISLSTKHYYILGQLLQITAEALKV